MAIAVHFINKPDPETRDKYETSFRRLDELDARHPRGRRSHVSWIIGEQLHVLDVWDSQEELDAYFHTLGPILEEFGMELAGPPEVGEVIQVIVPA